MVDFSLSSWLRRIFPKTLLSTRRKPRQVGLSRIEGLEDRALLTANLPVAVADTYNVNEDTTLNAVTVLGNDTDADGDLINRAVLSTGTAHGSLSLNSDGTFVYIPNANYNGVDSFTYFARDAAHNETGTVAATVTINILPVNDVPTATAASISTSEDVASGGTLTGTDVDGNPLTFSAGAVAAAHGVVTINSNGTFTYTPTANFNGVDAFSFKANDGTANSPDGTVSVTITPVNDAPTATAVSITVNEDGAFSGTLTGGDVDGDAVTFAAGALAAAHGTVVINPNGSFTYTPLANYNGPDSFSFKTNDGAANSTDATVGVTVTAVNDVPVATAVSITAIEDTLFSGTLSGTDVDGNPLTFSAGAIAAAHGVVVINPNGTYTYTPATNYNGSDAFSFKANDGTINSPDATVSVTVTAVNDAPVATAASITVNEDGAFSGALTGTDVDGNPLTFSAGSLATSHGTVTINSNGTYTYTPSSDYNGPDAFSFKANDGTTNSADATVSVTVSAVNDAPFATSASFTVNEDNVFSGTLTGTDVDGNPLTFSAGTLAAAHGTVVINSNGSFTYTPAANYNGSDSFRFKASDGTASSAEATVSVTVTAVPDVPVATAANITLSEDGAYSGTLTGTDADGDPLTFSAGAVAAAHGVVVINPNGTFTYTPAANYNGSDAFSFRASDGATNSLPATVSITVTAVNDVPVVAAVNLTTSEDLATGGTLTGSDVDGDSLTFSAGVLAAAHGTVVINPNGTFTYTPAANYNGTDAFSYKASDGTGSSLEAAVSVTITPVNDSPVATGGAAASFTVNEDGAYSSTLTGVDVDGSPLTFSAGSLAAAHGSVSISSNGAFTYTPAANYNGPDSFSFKVSDGTSNSPDATVSITVAAVNDAPVATAASITAIEDTAFNGTLAGTDVDGDALVFSAGTLAPAHGTVVINPNGSFSYTPVLNYNGSDTFRFKTSDGTAISAEATVTVTVTGVNDPPVAIGGVAANFSVGEDGAYSSTLTGIEVDGSPLTFSAGSLAAAHGSVTINSNGAFTYTPAANYNGPDSFSFKVNDGTSNSPDATVAVTVTPVNDAPTATASSFTVNEDSAFTGTVAGSDVEGDPLTFSAGTLAAAHGTVVINPNGSFTYTPDANYNGSDSFRFKANDGAISGPEATVSVTVSPVGDAPLANAASITVSEDGAFSNTLTGTDVDGDTLIFSAGSTAPAHGTVVINANGSYVYTPAANYTGSDAFSFKVSDGTTTSANATVSVVVTAVNDIPVVTATSLTTNEDLAVGGTLSGTDADGNPLTFLAGAGTAAHGTVVINANGSFTYTPSANYNGSDTFSFKASDGTSNSAEAIVSVTISPVNDAPITTAVTVVVNEDTTLGGSLSATDVDGDPLTYSAGTIAATHGTVTINPNGTFIYTPSIDFYGTDTFSFKASDASTSSGNATVTVTVTPTSDPPVATSSSISIAEDGAFSGTLTGMDPDGDPLNFSAGTLAVGHGTLTVNPSGTFTYRPVANFNGTDSFSFKVNDGTTTSGEATLLIFVTPVNNLPVVTAAAITTTEDTAFNGTLAGSDIDGDSLTFAAGAVAPNNGTLTINPNGTFNYAPRANFSGVDAFSYLVNDGTANSTAALVTVTIVAVNDAPVATPATITIVEETVLTGQLNAIDAEGSPVTFAPGAVTPTHGTVVINSNGTFSYTPTANFSGSDAFSFTASDGTSTGAPATVTVNVTAVNDPPVASPLSLTAIEDTTVGGTLTATDADADLLVFSAGTIAAAHGTATINANGTFTYTPAANYTGTDTFRYKVNDGKVNSPEATVTVTFTAVNDAPIGTASSRTITEDTVLGSTLTGTDAEGDPLTFSAGLTPATHGTVVIASNGAFTYTPQANFNGSDSFSFKITDGLLISADATITITVTAVADPPVIIGTNGNGTTSITTNEDTTFSGTLTATDPDGDPLTFSAGSLAAAHGTVVINANGSFTYTPQANYNGSDSFTYKVNDGIFNSTDATVNVTVLAVNDVPVANAVGITTNEDSAFTGTLTGTDADGNPLNFTGGLISAAHGTAVINPNGSFTYTPQANFNGTDSFTFKVNDGIVNSAEAIVTFTVIAVQDIPVANPTNENSNITTNEDTTFVGTLTGSDSDGDPLTFSAGAVGAANGIVIINPNGSFTYRPGANFNGSDTFSYKVNDGRANSADAIVSVTITPVNDVPAANATSITTDEDVAFNGTLTGTDADGDALVFSAGAVAAGHGSVILQSNGTFTYTPAANFNGTDSFSFKVNDGLAGSTESTVTISVTSVNDNPFVSDGAGTLEQDANFSASFAVLASDVEGDSKSFRVVNPPAHGRIALSPDGSFVYTPDVGFSGTDTCVVKANDGHGDSNDATYVLTVTDLFQLQLATTPGTIATKKKAAVPHDPTARLILVSPSVNFANASISVGITAGRDRPDRIFIPRRAGAAGPVFMRGKRVFFNGSEVARITGGLRGQSLQIAFNGSGTLDAVNAVLERVSVRTTRNANRAIRTIQFQVRASRETDTKTIGGTVR